MVGQVAINAELLLRSLLLTTLPTQRLDDDAGATLQGRRETAREAIVIG